MTNKVTVLTAGVGMLVGWRFAIEFLLSVGFPPGTIYWLFSLMMMAWMMDQVEKE